LTALDEIHPLSATSVLERVEEHLKDEQQRRPNGFCHVFVFGRPEAFRGYYLAQPMRKKESLVEMKFPRYLSMKDLEVAVESSRAFYKRTPTGMARPSSRWRNSTRSSSRAFTAPLAGSAGQ